MLISKKYKKYPLRIKVTNRISDIPADDWNGVYPDVIEGYQFFRTLDELNLEQFRFYYMVVYSGKKAVAATPCFLMDYPLDSSVDGPVRRITNRIKKVMPRFFSLKAFICGMPMGQGRIGIVGDRQAALEVILRKMEQIAKKRRAPVIAFKDFDRSYSDVLGPLLKRGFTRFSGLPNTEMNIEFGDLEGYLKTLSPASRYDFRRKFKKVPKDLNIEMSVHDSISGADIEAVFRLYMEVVVGHDMGFEVLPIGFFRSVSENMPGKAKFFLWRIDKRIVAFSLSFVSGGTLMLYYTGLDYSVAHKYHLYFFVFRDVLNWCMEHNIKIFEMGYKGYETKRRLGFDFIPLGIYVKLRNKTLRPIFNAVAQLLKFENFDPALKKVEVINGDDL